MRDRRAAEVSRLVRGQQVGRLRRKRRHARREDAAQHGRRRERPENREQCNRRDARDPESPGETGEPPRQRRDSDERKDRPEPATAGRCRRLTNVGPAIAKEVGAERNEGDREVFRQRQRDDGNDRERHTMDRAGRAARQPREAKDGQSEHSSDHEGEGQVGEKPAEREERRAARHGVPARDQDELEQPDEHHHRKQRQRRDDVFRCRTGRRRTRWRRLRRDRQAQKSTRIPASISTRFRKRPTMISSRS